MYASTAACSINVASTSNLPNQQHSAATIPTTTPAMYYVSQLPADAYGKQIIQYGGDSTATVQYGQENVYPSKEVYTVNISNLFNKFIFVFSHQQTLLIDCQPTVIIYPQVKQNSLPMSNFQPNLQTR